ncbi:isopentenyl transferase [Streptomyces ipomoeae]|uniref:Isopentenyl transferase n=2 Tax=Streptomyces ipomoeae TaxID=103232 RepID=L1KPR8_9ACTN|nr:isopentenyl transferase family protein [Streptomyces ipomoeae]EKX62358.1 isopentenyl transferase [Streptomyces ipomoeae 91-03]MDX2696116.1 isopentenyl transferase family protein [Streptomyces ipomoeae]MDX2843135.1 isopentenyl transferase family protein [Streptomyces ipomoeae]TQE26549.1 isopentenyl transferase [Streptomyces ipomoeae]TQE28007.1 isopentenyl transferase [Streptomyces ipomoeae]
MADTGTHVETSPLVHLIAGPTGVGKSAAATELARETGAPVVVADRLQCFTDLATASARAGAEVPDVQRYWLGDRTVADGDLSASAATDALVALVERLAIRHPLVIVEGGSISLLRELSERRAALSWRLTVRLMPLPDRSDYVAALTRRARTMLAPPPPERGLLDELATLWRDPHRRYFAASVNGFETVLECCAKYSLDVKTLHKRNLPEHILARMAALIAERHAEHGILQHQVFTEIFADRISGSRCDLGALERVA